MLQSDRDDAVRFHKFPFLMMQCTRLYDPVIDNLRAKLQNFSRCNAYEPVSLLLTT
jgi:hypothetical protein